MQGAPQGLADRFSALHERFVLRHPVLVLVACALVVGFFSWHARDFALDATADSLTLENDAVLSYYRMVRARYGSDDFPDSDFLAGGRVIQRAGSADAA